jgi:hypothetical protein
MMVRKVFKRLKRKWYGEKYIRSIINDLSTRGDESSAKARNVLCDLVNGSGAVREALVNARTAAEMLTFLARKRDSPSKSDLARGSRQLD